VDGQSPGHNVVVGAGRYRVITGAAGRSAETSLGAGNDFGHVRTQSGATSSIGGGAGRDILVSDDGERTAISCGAGHDSLTVASADRPGAGCGVRSSASRSTPARGVPGRRGGRANAAGVRAVRGALNGNVLTIRGLGPLPSKTVVSAFVGTRTQLAGATTVRRPAGKLALTKQGRASLSPGAAATRGELIVRRPRDQGQPLSWAARRFGATAR
jgi:hypothetical protein